MERNLLGNYFQRFSVFGSPVVSIDIEKFYFPSMSEEHEIRDGVDSKTCYSFKSISKNDAVASVHFRSNYSLLTSYICPEKQPPNWMHGDASWLFRVASVDDTNRIVAVEAE